MMKNNRIIKIVNKKKKQKNQMIKLKTQKINFKKKLKKQKQQYFKIMIEQI